MSAPRSIRHYLLTSWMLSLLLAVAGSAVLSLGISYLDYINHRQALKIKLRDDAQTIARRVSAELQLKKNGRLNAVLEQLITDYELYSLDVSKSAAPHAIRRPSIIQVSEEIPGIIPKSFIQATRLEAPLTIFINFRNFLFALIPILALALTGFLIQRRFLRRYIIRPIEALAETSSGAGPVRDYWPMEIQKIAQDLAESFSAREQAVFGQLSQGLIHDIRTLIHSINTALQLLAETPEGHPERQTRLERLATSTARNTPKIRELLDLSLDSSREITLRPKSEDISETVRQAVQNVMELANAKGVTISTDCLAKAQLIHDRTQLERVLTNLIKNGIEAAEDSSKSEVAVQSEVLATGLRLHVEDSGKGITNPKHIFRPLKTTKTHGYGLGLFVSRKIVEAHHGKLIAGSSQSLGGAKFTLEIPHKEVGA